MLHPGVFWVCFEWKKRFMGCVTHISAGVLLLFLSVPRILNTADMSALNLIGLIRHPTRAMASYNRHHEPIIELYELVPEGLV